MPLFRLSLIAAGLCLATAALAQTGTEPQPISPIGLAEVLSRPASSRLSVPRTQGHVDLKGKAFYIAEYRVMVDQAGEIPAQTRNGQLLGRAVKDDEATLAYRSQPDTPMLQALVDRAWDDLKERLRSAGIETEDDDDVTSEHGAVYKATQTASTPQAPLLVEALAGDTLRRYLVLAPTGQKLIARSAAGMGAADAAARAKYLAANVEALSLALAVNLSALEAGGNRRSSYTAPPGPEASLSPLMELRPAPGAALVQAHAQSAQVVLSEAFVLATEFGRLRAGEPHAKPPAASTSAAPGANRAVDLLLAAVGKAMGGGPAAPAPAARPRVEAELELDGAPTARLLAYCFAAANQAIVDALKAGIDGTP